MKNTALQEFDLNRFILRNINGFLTSQEGEFNHITIN